MDTDRKIALFYITKGGFELAQRLKGFYPRAEIVKFHAERVSAFWNEGKPLLFIMAAGIVVRAIASLAKDKRTDPAVVVLDEKGRFAISLLSGHIGGANALAKEVAEFLGGEAVITTASDVNDLPSVDLWAREHHLAIENWDALSAVSTKLINTGALRVYSEISIDLPETFLEVSDPECADVLIAYKGRTNFSAHHAKEPLYLRPRNLVLGIGCNRGTDADEIESAVRAVMEAHSLAFSAIRSLATLDKKGDEPGLVAFAQTHDFKLETFTPAELNAVRGISKSEIVFRATGANAVSEPAALLASEADVLLVSKQKMGNVTVAVAEMHPQKGKDSKIYVVGTGPGGIEHITPRAFRAIRAADVIIGYKTYLDLIPDLIEDKEVISFGMTQEVERGRRALEIASEGKSVAVISGGDPGVYGMAGLVLEVLKNSDSPSKPHVEVLPGVSALNACAARLGAPIMHDFAVISLSDRLTPWEAIRKRLEAASAADFVIALYNPKSKGRPEHIRRAGAIILKHRKPETPVGIVRAATRETDRVIVTNLKELLDCEMDMQTTIIIGNSQTFVFDGYLVTPRGYLEKYGLARR